MRRPIAFLILLTVWVLSRVFFRAHYRWIGPHPKNPWKKTRLIVFLNHTSLYEPIFMTVFPISYLWHIAGHANVPGADITLNRPIVGFFWKLMVPRIAPVTRKRDESWSNFLNSIREDDLIAIAPEGRMKRENGLDKNGQPMTVKGGVADIIDSLQTGGMVICISGGLHHVQVPGQFLPRPFQTIHMDCTFLDIAEYLKPFSSNPYQRKLDIIADLQRRLENDCPRGLVEG